MNSKTREELVADLTVTLQRVKYVKLGESLRPIAEEIIDRLLAYRAETMPSEVEEDDEPFEQKMERITADLSEQFTKSKEKYKIIMSNLKNFMMKI